MVQQCGTIMVYQEWLKCGIHVIGKSLTLVTVLFVLMATKPCTAAEPKDPPKEVARRTNSEAKGKIEQQLALEDVVITIESSAGELEKLPETITVRYKNKSSRRGYQSLPGPYHGQSDGPYRVPSVAIETRASGGESYFLYAPDENKQPLRASVAMMNPGESVVVEYALSDFCLIGHGIEPDLTANMRTCYHIGSVPSELRICVITDWNKSTGTAPFRKSESDPLVVKLSVLDISKHRTFRDGVGPK